MRLAVLTMSLSLLAGPLCAQPAAEFAALFDGTMNGWSIENSDAGNFSIENGVLRIAGPPGWLRSADRYSDFSLRVEFRFVSDDADSGIFLRAPGNSAFGPGWPANSYQVQLRNPVGQSRFPPVGGVFRHGMPDGETTFDWADADRLSTGTGEWQLLEIDLTGDVLAVRLNGDLLTEASGIEESTGYIGIQGETGALEFRSIEILEH